MLLPVVRQMAAGHVTLPELVAMGLVDVRQIFIVLAQLGGVFLPEVILLGCLMLAFLRRVREGGVCQGLRPSLPSLESVQGIEFFSCNASNSETRAAGTMFLEGLR